MHYVATEDSSTRKVLWALLHFLSISRLFQDPFTVRKLEPLLAAQTASGLSVFARLWSLLMSPVIESINATTDSAI